MAETGKDFDEHLVRFRKLPAAAPRGLWRDRAPFVALRDRHRRILRCCRRSLRLVTRLLIGWDVFIALYLMLAYGMMLSSGGQKHIRRNAALQDDGSFIILLVAAAGRLRQHRGHRVRTWRTEASHGLGVDAGDRHHRLVLGRGAHDVLAALCPSVLSRAKPGGLAVSVWR